MPKRKTAEEMNFTYVECLLFTFHHLASKVIIAHIFEISSYIMCHLPVSIIVICVKQAPNASNSLCGYKIVTGQPSDRLGEDFTEQYKDFTER